MHNDINLKALLTDIRNCMKRLDIWEITPPDRESLASTQPFAIDTLTPEQWLQWIFIPRMGEMLDNEQPPKGFSITPYFEEVWKSEQDKAELLALLFILDEACR